MLLEMLFFEMSDKIDPARKPPWKLLMCCFNSFSLLQILSHISQFFSVQWWNWLTCFWKKNLWQNIWHKYYICDEHYSCALYVLQRTVASLLHKSFIYKFLILDISSSKYSLRLEKWFYKSNMGTKSRFHV